MRPFTNKYSQDAPGGMCSICLIDFGKHVREGLDFLMQECCNQPFHPECLDEWWENCVDLKRKRTCPHCRAGARDGGNLEDDGEEESEDVDSDASSATIASVERIGRENEGWSTSDPRFWDIGCFDWPKWADNEYPTEEEHDRDSGCEWDSNPDERKSSVVPTVVLELTDDFAGRDPPYYRARSVHYRGVRYDPTEARELFRRENCRCRRCHCPRCGRLRCSRPRCPEYIANLDAGRQDEGGGEGIESEEDDEESEEALERAQKDNMSNDALQAEVKQELDDIEDAGYDADSDD